MKVTIKDIAKIAGVSYSTVSRSLNDHPSISDKTKNKIKKIAKEMKFEFNYSARSLKSRKTDTIGVISPEVFDEMMAGLFLGAIIKNIRENLDQISYDTILAFHKNRITHQSNVEKLINRNKVDGLLIVEKEVSEEDIELIQTNNVPTVFLHYKPLHMNERMNVIYTDHYQGAYLATKHLLELGHRKIIHIIYEFGLLEWEFQQRLEGFKAALAEYNIEYNKDYVFDAQLSYDKAYKIVEDNVEMFDEVTAIFAATDYMALGAMNALKDLKIKVPEEVSVVGYDDIALLKLNKPLLTTIHQPIEKITKLGYEKLLEEINNKSDKRTYVSQVVSPDLIIRESTAKVRK